MKTKPWITSELASALREPAKAAAFEPSRRRLLQATGSVIAAAAFGLGGSRTAYAKQPPANAKQPTVVPAPVFYPGKYTRQVNLHGKNVVITGASRGIGRATALELSSAGASVWGTSRTPQDYPGITEYPLLPLRLEDPASIAAFVPAIGAATAGRVDVLINNAGQMVFGTVTPTDPSHFGLWAQNSALALQVLYLGHQQLTAAMLGFMLHGGYRRILFTASAVAYASGADLASDFYQPYVAGKRGVADLANSLRNWFARAALDIGVATVNPVATSTDLGLGTRPIFLEPVDEDGNPHPASPLATVVALFRDFGATGQPPAVVAGAYRQLLELERPHPNVIAGAASGPIAEAGQVPLTLAVRQNEMELGAMPWECRKIK